jgi:hypothetical protein
MELRRANRRVRHLLDVKVACECFDLNEGTAGHEREPKNLILRDSVVDKRQQARTEWAWCALLGAQNVAEAWQDPHRALTRCPAADTARAREERRRERRELKKAKVRLKDHTHQ